MSKCQILSKNFEGGRKGPSKGSKRPIKEVERKSNGNYLISKIKRIQQPKIGTFDSCIKHLINYSIK
jgi:hypothetical protein